MYQNPLGKSHHDYFTRIRKVLLGARFVPQSRAICLQGHSDRGTHLIFFLFSTILFIMLLRTTFTPTLYRTVVTGVYFQYLLSRHDRWAQLYRALQSYTATSGRAMRSFLVFLSINGRIWSTKPKWRWFSATWLVCLFVWHEILIVDYFQRRAPNRLKILQARYGPK